MSHPPGNTPLTISVGHTLDDKYQVLSVLGEGAMGTVYSAFHLGLEQHVAIKVLRGGSPEHDVVARQRFQREARAAARIQSEYACRVLDTGTLADGVPYLVMEQLEGCDLEAELATRGRLPVGEAVCFVRQACLAMAEAHRAGIVHRDLKPANLFLHAASTGKRIVKVLDFGVSKASASNGGAQMSLTRTSALVGSPIYMSPEQLRSAKDVDGRADVWALGAVLVELLTGKTPFDEETIGQLVNAILFKEAPTLAELGCEAPPALSEVVQRALHKDRDQRYQSADELWAALAPFDETADASVWRSAAGALAPSIERTSLASTTGQTARVSDATVTRRSPLARRRWQLAALLLAAGAGALMLFFGTVPREAATPRAIAPPRVDASVAPAQLEAEASEPKPALSPSEDVMRDQPEQEARPATAEAPRTATPALPSAVPEAEAERESTHQARRRHELRAARRKLEDASAREAVGVPVEAQLPSFGGRR